MINFQDLYESYATYVYRFALWLSNDSLEAEDITSETFTRALVEKYLETDSELSKLQNN